MKVVVAGAFGHLGSDIVRSLVSKGHDVTGFGRTVRPIAGCEGQFRSVKADAQNPESLIGLFEGADIVISTVGLTKASAEVSCYDVDYQGNMNILNAARHAGVKRFAYVSVLKADCNPSVPMLDAKAKFENQLKHSSMKWVIFRPSGYFYDIAKVFRKDNIISAFFETSLGYVVETQFVCSAQFFVPFSNIGRYRYGCTLELRAQAKLLEIRVSLSCPIYKKYKLVCLLPCDNILKLVRHNYWLNFFNFFNFLTSLTS